MSAFMPIGFEVSRRIRRSPSRKSWPWTYVSEIGCTTPSPPASETAATSSGLLHGYMAPHTSGTRMPAWRVRAVSGTALLVEREVGVALEGFLVALHEAARLGHREALLAQRRLDQAAHARDQVFLVVLHVREHLGHRVALDHVVDAVVVAVDLHVHRVGVAEQVVQVAQDLLVCADQERGDQVLFAVRAVQLEEALHVPELDELVDLAVAVAGEVGHDAAPARLLVQAVDR